jgi:hypothetical protein
MIEQDKLKEVCRQRGYLDAIHDIRNFLEEKSITINGLFDLFKKYEQESDTRLEKCNYSK